VVKRILIPRLATGNNNATPKPFVVPTDTIERDGVRINEVKARGRFERFCSSGTAQYAECILRMPDQQEKPTGVLSTTFMHIDRRRQALVALAELSDKSILVIYRR